MSRVAIFASVLTCLVLRVSGETAGGEFSDSFAAGPGQTAASLVNDRPIGGEGGRWRADRSIVVAVHGGATSTTVDGGLATFAVPTVAGRYKLAARLGVPKEKTFIGVALGQNSLSTDFFRGVAVSVGLVRDGQFEVRANGFDKPGLCLLVLLASCGATPSVGRPVPTPDNVITDSLMRSPTVSNYAARLNGPMVVMKESVDGVNRILTLGEDAPDQMLFGMVVKLTPDGRVFIRIISDIGDTEWIDK